MVREDVKYVSSVRTCIGQFKPNHNPNLTWPGNILLWFMLYVSYYIYYFKRIALVQLKSFCLLCYQFPTNEVNKQYMLHKLKQVKFDKTGEK